MRRPRTYIPLLFPYLCAALIVGLIVYGNTRTSSRVSLPSAAGMAACAGCGGDVDPATGVRHETETGEVLHFCCEGCRGMMTERSGETGAKPGAHLDPVCQMTVGETLAAALGGKDYYFCTPHCRELFLEDPERYLADVCIVCRSEDRFNPVEPDAPQVTWEGVIYRFCSVEHRDAFRSDPAGYFMHSMWGIPNWLYYVSIAVVLLLSFGLFEFRASRRESGQEPAAAPLEQRFDLFRFRWLHRLIVARYTRFICQLIFVAAFLMILAAGLFGNQLPGKNVAPLLTWTVWWGGLIALILYLGKAWCYVCPWNAIADWAESLRFWGPRRQGLSLNLKWPRWMRNIWPATLLFVGLTWVELGFGVTLNPRVTAWLGLLMLVLTFVCAFLFDRRSFCRYGCLVGRVSGLYALFAPVEIRARDREICRTCESKACFKGSEAGDPCPTFEFLGTMKQNTYCISCMECVKTCDKDNVALNLRPWGADLASHGRPRTDEAYLSLLMLSLTGFHGLTMTARWQDVVEVVRDTLHLGEIAAFSLGMLLITVAPIALYAILVGFSYRLAGGASNVRYRDYFIRYAYAVLPIALFYHLAHNSEHLLMEGQKVVALLSDPFGREWNLIGTADWTLAPLINLPTLWIMQAFLVLVGHVYSLWIARRVAEESFSDFRTAFRSQLPMLTAMILFSLMSLWLLKQPMQMRSSAM